MLGANKAQVIIRHVVYVGHCQVPARWKAKKSEEKSPDGTCTRNCNPFSKQEARPKSFSSVSGGLGVPPLQNEAHLNDPLYQGLGIFDKKQASLEESGKTHGEMALRDLASSGSFGVSVAVTVLLCLALFYLEAPEMGRGGS